VKFKRTVPMLAPWRPTGYRDIAKQLLSRNTNMHATGPLSACHTVLMSVLTMSGDVCIYGVRHQILLLGWRFSHTRHQIQRGVVVLATAGAAGCSHRLNPSVLKHGTQKLGRTDHHLSTNELHAAVIWSYWFLSESTNPRLLWIRKFDYNVQNSPPLVPILSRINSIYIFESCF
jgi:hypothetical protein